MRLYTSNEAKTIDVGTGSIWYSIYSTACIALSENVKKSIPLAMDFLKTGECAATNANQTKKQLSEIINAFSKLDPDKAIYNLHKPDVVPPWKGNIAQSVTSCANLYTTADGKDLFSEVMDLLQYAQEKGVDIFAG